MPGTSAAQDFITTNGIGAKFVPTSGVLLILIPGQEPLPQLLERAAGGIAEILVDEGQIERLGEKLGGKNRAQMEEAFSVAARGTYNRVIFSTD